MKARYLLLCGFAVAAAVGICTASPSRTGSKGNVKSIIVVQSTPGDGLVHRTFELDDSDQPISRVAPPKAWTINLTEEDLFAGAVENGARLAHEGGQEPSTTPALIWARHTETGSIDLVYSTFNHGAWTSPSEIGSGANVDLDHRWWRDSLLGFVQADPDLLLGTETLEIDGVPFAVLVDTHIDSSNTMSPVHIWTIFVDQSILVLPSTRLLRDGEPSLGATRLGGALVPTVTWAHASSAGNHDPMIVRFVDDSWTSPQAISTSSSDDVEPIVVQDQFDNIHGTWKRIEEDDSSGSIRYSKMQGAFGAFSSDESVSRSDEDARGPSVAVRPEGDVFIAYESHRDGSHGVVVAHRVSGIGGRGESVFRRHLIARTKEGSAPELSMISGKRLVLTWVDGETRIGRAVYSRGTWTSPHYEAIKPIESIEKARNRVAKALEGADR